MKDSFILNRNLVSSEEPCGKVLVDIIRKDFSQKGTTVACREGDCGACTVLVGELKGNEVYYRSVTSCISPWANAPGKHIVTIEGLNRHKETLRVDPDLNPLQNLFREQNATQCGYCTPGFIVSLAGFLLRGGEVSLPEAISSIDGNICRCTGYKSIERTVAGLIQDFRDRLHGAENRLEALINSGLIPEYFRDIPGRLRAIGAVKKQHHRISSDQIVIGGGTDLLVQKPDQLYPLKMSGTQGILKEGIRIKDGKMQMGAACRIEDFRLSPLVQKFIPDIRDLLKLFASTQIRHQGTLAGNIVNASPIGDMANLFLALNADLHLDGPEGKRTIALKDFYTGYKQTVKKADEWISHLSVVLPDKSSRINLEKVSKRTYLDIASVTTSMHVKTDESEFLEATFSAGGVGPVPMQLPEMGSFLCGKEMNCDVVREATGIALEEVSPLSDVRGSREYKRLLLRQLLYAHFIKKFPDRFSLTELVS